MQINNRSQLGRSTGSLNQLNRVPSLFDEIRDRESWQTQGACTRETDIRGMAINPDMWFKQSWPQTEDMKRVKRICQQECPVRAECLAYILAHPQEGTWAGLTEKERRESREAERINSAEAE